MLYFLAPLAVFWIMFFLMPHRYQWAFMDGSMARARVIFRVIAVAANRSVFFLATAFRFFFIALTECVGSFWESVDNRLESDEQRYLNDCQKYGDTLPAFSSETERIMRREGHWIGCMAKPRTLNSSWERHGEKAPAELMRVWPKEPDNWHRLGGYSWQNNWRPSGYMQKRYGLKPSPITEREGMRQMEQLRRMAGRM